MKKAIAWILTAAAIVATAALAVIAYQLSRNPSQPELSTPYHAVALTNGEVFFGRIDALGGDYAVLRDVFYIQTRQNPDTKQVSNVLIKRGGEWHAPDRMIVSREHIVFIEPVGKDSQVAKLIADQERSQ